MVSKHASWNSDVVTVTLMTYVIMSELRTRDISGNRAYLESEYIEALDGCQAGQNSILSQGHSLESKLYEVSQRLTTK